MVPVAASTSTSPQSEVELVVVLVVASTPTSPQSVGELVVVLVVALVLVRLSAVMSMLLSEALLLSLKLL